MVRENLKQDFCQKHETEKFYFCITCQKSLCPDCYIERHLGHKKNHIKKEYADVKRKIQNELEVIKSSQADLKREIESA